jgi:hypothetical protein
MDGDGTTPGRQPMTAQPAGPAPGPYQTIRLGGQDAAVVPLADLTRWRNRAEAAEGRAEELLDALEDTGVIASLSAEQMGALLGAALPARRAGEKTFTTEEVRQQLGLPR